MSSQHRNEKDCPPWYKQIWLVVLVIIPSMIVAASFALIIYILLNTDPKDLQSSALQSKTQSPTTDQSTL